jgi:hypothetical protein
MASFEKSKLDTVQTHEEPTGTEIAARGVASFNEAIIAMTRE